MNAQVRASTKSTDLRPDKENRIDLAAMVTTKTGALQQLKIKLVPPCPPSTNPEPVDNVSDNDKTSNGQRMFCPKVHREKIINMIENHYCAHPLIPGYAPPSPAGIKKWAVQQMYSFCTTHELPEVWAYLWENWYRKGRWELWARSVHPQIPVLKTTMILESQLVINCKQV